MAIVSFKILTRKYAGGGHAETEVTIDWNGITQDELMLLARNALIHDLQARMTKASEAIPAKAYIVAREVANLRPAALDKWQPPKSTLDVRLPKGLEEALKGLSKAELQALLG